jgi:hypothetical protein
VTGLLGVRADRHGADRKGRRRLHDRTHEAGLVVELAVLPGGQLAQRFYGDGELAARAPLVPYPPTMPSMSSTG